MHTLPIKYSSDGLFPRTPVRGLVLLALTVLAVLALYYALAHRSTPLLEITQQEMFNLIKEGRVTRLYNEPDASTGIRNLVGVTHGLPSDSGAARHESGMFRVAVDPMLEPNLMNEIRQAGYRGTVETVNNTNVAWPLFLNLVPVLLFIIVLTLTFRGLARWVLAITKG